LRDRPFLVRFSRAGSGGFLYRSSQHENHLYVPLWPVLAVLFAVLPPVWWLTRLAPPGHCPVCRYNLTGNVSGVCPECGHARSEHDDDIRGPWPRPAARTAVTYAVLAIATAPLAAWAFFYAFSETSRSLLNTAVGIGVGHLLLAPLALPIAAYAARYIARRKARALAQQAADSAT